MQSRGSQCAPARLIQHSTIQRNKNTLSQVNLQVPVVLWVRKAGACSQQPAAVSWPRKLAPAFAWLCTRALRLIGLV